MASQYIDIGIPTKLVFTLYAQTSNKVNPYFTFLIKNKESLKTYTFSSVDFSTAPWYWNAYTFSVSSTQSDPSNGIIQAPFGQYVYNVYEMATQSLDIASYSVGVVDNGNWTINTPTVTIQSNNHIPKLGTNNHI